MSYHYKDSRTSTSKDSPIHLTKFVVNFVLPEPLRERYGSRILVEQVKSIGGLTMDQMPDAVEQMYRAQKRRFAGTVPETNVDVEMTFAVNEDRNNAMYPYNVLRDWCRLIYDPNNAFQAPKRDYAGSATIELHNKLGQVLRKTYFETFFPLTAPNAFDLEYGNEAIYELAMTFVGENFVDESY